MGIYLIRTITIDTRPTSKGLHSASLMTTGPAINQLLYFTTNFDITMIKERLLLGEVDQQTFLT